MAAIYDRNGKIKVVDLKKPKKKILQKYVEHGVLTPSETTSLNVFNASTS